MKSVDDLLAAFNYAATRQYGDDAVSELEHSLQCADLALDGSGDMDLALAALLHDIGRFAIRQDLIFDSKEQPGRKGVVRGHHHAGADLIAPWVSPRVEYCVRSHADAKRYLCTVEPAYAEQLNAAAIRTMKVQGGLMSRDELAAFESAAFYKDAVRLRRWDDAAKVPGRHTRELRYWEPILHELFAQP